MTRILDNRLYVLDGKLPVVEPNLRAWAHWMETSERVLWQDQVGVYRVSTVFLGLDHNFGFAHEGKDRTPVLFETMIFGHGHKLDEEMWRYRTWEEAQAGHLAAVQLAKEAA